MSEITQLSVTIDIKTASGYNVKSSHSSAIRERASAVGIAALRELMTYLMLDGQEDAVSAAVLDVARNVQRLNTVHNSELIGEKVPTT